jgi:sugar phosphate isomerase/epimerase
MGTPDMTPVEAMRLFRSLDIDAAEIIWQNGYKSGIPEEENRDVLRAVEREITSSGLAVCGIAPYMRGLAGLDEIERQHDLHRFRRAIEDAHFLGARFLRVYAGSFFRHEAEVRQLKWQQLLRSLTELGPIADAAGATLVVENHAGTLAASAQEMVELMTSLDGVPGIGILYDQVNLTASRQEAPTEAVAMQSPWIRHTHVKDFVFDDAVDIDDATSGRVGAPRATKSRAVGDGIEDWGTVFAEMRRTEYDETLTIEYEYRWFADELPAPESGFAQSLNAIRQLWR